MARQWLRISNPQETSPVLVTTWGASLNRNDDKAIGQFGSGAKHGILCFLRAKQGIRVFCGTTQLKFSTKSEKVSETESIKKVYVSQSEFGAAGRPKNWTLNVDLSFGHYDWTNKEMGLREFVSNALDGSEYIEDVKMEVIDKPEPKGKGWTSVCVPYTRDVQEYHEGIGNHFTQFTIHKHKKVWDNPNPKKNGRVHRAGVFVRETEKPSMYCYNLSKGVKVDECRNMTDFDCRYHSFRIVEKDKEAIKGIFRALLNGEEVWETTDDFCYDVYGRDTKTMWVEAWKEVAGENCVITLDNIPEMVLAHASAHCYQVAFVPSQWFKSMANAGIPTIMNIKGVNKDGVLECEPTQRMVESVQRVWDWMVILGVDTKGKDAPKVMGFTQDEETLKATQKVLQGFRGRDDQRDTVFINKDYDNDLLVYVEEVGHYVSDYCDCTREFQEFFMEGLLKACLSMGG